MPVTGDEMDKELKDKMDTPWETEEHHAKDLISILLRHNQHWRAAAAYWHGVNAGVNGLVPHLVSEIEFLRGQI